LSGIRSLKPNDQKTARPALETLGGAALPGRGGVNYELQGADRLAQCQGRITG
jgi:hypothetical protein